MRAVHECRNFYGGCIKVTQAPLEIPVGHYSWQGKSNWRYHPQKIREVLGKNFIRSRADDRVSYENSVHLGSIFKIEKGMSVPIGWGIRPALGKITSPERLYRSKCIGISRTGSCHIDFHTAQRETGCLVYTLSWLQKKCLLPPWDRTMIEFNRRDSPWESNP